MKIDIISDLHLKEKEEIESVKGTGEVIIVAGDISSDIEIVAGFLNFLSTNYKAVLFTFGNIELWHENPGYNVEKLKQSLNNNVYLLDFLEGIKINGKKFSGGIYFSKSLLTANDREKIAKGNNSFLSKLEQSSRINFHAKLKTFNPDIVISHYPPISIGNMRKTETVNFKNYNRIWIFGHYHHLSNFFGKDDLNKNTIYVCNCNNQPLKIKI